MSVGKRKKQHFRADIQGLRAVAVLLVALDHADIGPFHGGFIGVDVFFVISGFLITSLLLKEAGRTGTVSLRDFYARRARRILPAALVVIVATLAMSVAFFDGVRALAVGEDAIWATFFAANIDAALSSADYFASPDPSPLQHYWSLAVEEQFYLIWPLLLLFTVVFLRDWFGGPRRAVIALLAVLGTLSVGWSLHATATDPLTGYFSTAARAWELAIGAATAALLPYLDRAGPALRAVLSWVGLALIGFAALTFSSATEFPGIAAALPCFGAAFLLVGGAASHEWENRYKPQVAVQQAARWGPQGMLGTLPMRAVGDWSYSIYLWHWPLLIMAEALWGPNTWWRGSMVLVVTLALSAATYRWIETPFREAPALTKVPLARRRSLMLYPAMVAVVLTSVAATGRVVEESVGGGDGEAITVEGAAAGHPQTGEGEDRVVALVEASVLAARNGQEVPGNLRPQPLELGESVPDLGDCDYFRVATEDLELCPGGDADGTRAMVLIGDSHARQWIPALDAIAEQHGFRTYWLVRSGCPALDLVPYNEATGLPTTACAEFQQWAVDQVAELEPYLTVLATDVNSQGLVDADGVRVAEDDPLAELVTQGMAAQVEKVAPHSDRVVVIGDPPVHEIGPTKCLTTRGVTLMDCLSPPEPRSLLMIDAIRQGARAAGAEYVRTTPWFCHDGMCPTVVGDMVTHRDSKHVSVPYAEALTGVLSERLGLHTTSG